MEAPQINIHEMIDLALARPKGAVNFNILCSLLHVIAKNLPCEDSPIEFHGPIATEISKNLEQRTSRPFIHVESEMRNENTMLTTQVSSRVLIVNDVRSAGEVTLHEEQSTGRSVQFDEAVVTNNSNREISQCIRSEISLQGDDESKKQAEEQAIELAKEQAEEQAKEQAIEEAKEKANEQAKEHAIEQAKRMEDMDNLISKLMKQSDELSTKIEVQESENQAHSEVSAELEIVKAKFEQSNNRFNEIETLIESLHEKFSHSEKNHLDTANENNDKLKQLLSDSKAQFEEMKTKFEDLRADEMANSECIEANKVKITELDSRKMDRTAVEDLLSKKIKLQAAVAERRHEAFAKMLKEMKDAMKLAEDRHETWEMAIEKLTVDISGKANLEELMQLQNVLMEESQKLIGTPNLIKDDTAGGSSRTFKCICCRRSVSMRAKQPFIYSSTKFMPQKKVWLQSRAFRACYAM